MSSSLFDLFCKNDAYYVSTKYSDGDKRFEEIDTNDILYYVPQYGEIEEIISKGKLKQYKGHIILSTISNGKQFTIDFSCKSFDTANWKFTWAGSSNDPYKSVIAVQMI